MANSTAGTIIGRIRAMLRADSGSDVPVISDDFLLFAISDGNLKYASAFNTNGAEPVAFQREFGVTLVPDGALSVAALTTDVTLTLTSSSTFPAASNVAVWTQEMPDVIAYTGNNLAQTLSGVSGIGFAHAINDSVQLLYKLPADFGDFREEPTYGDGVKLNGAALTYMGGPPLPGTFSLYDDGTNKYLWLPRKQTGYASVWYDKVSSSIAATSDIVDVPPDYQMYLVWYAMSLCYVGREKDFNLMMAAEKKAQSELQRALQNRNKHKKIRPRPMPRASRMRDYTTLNGSVIPL